MATNRFDELIAAADAAPFAGWDFSHLRGRMIEEPMPFDYLDEVRRVNRVASMLDLGTGGGEVLAQLAPLPARTVATESYPPNAIVAARRLRPLGAQVVLVEGAPENYSTVETPVLDRPALPFRSESFEFVIDRHESHLPAEVYRMLRPGGRFITQQCGGTHFSELNDLLGLPPPRYEAWSLAGALKQLRAVSFKILQAKEAFAKTTFRDAGAVVYYLKTVPWQVPDFKADDYLKPLRAIHDRIENTGPFTVRAHHFLVECVKPV
ncbi:MAG: class I SAM-dependent methyltransferase [Candidatus Binataceae bacterium]